MCNTLQMYNGLADSFEIPVRTWDMGEREWNSIQRNLKDLSGIPRTGTGMDGHDRWTDKGRQNRQAG